MFYYRPPKGKFFGHSLKRFSPVRQSELADAFLERAAFNHCVQDTTLTIGSARGTKSEPFQEVIESVSKLFDNELEIIGGNMTRSLSPDEFSLCIPWLIQIAPLPDTMDCIIMMARNHKISSWKIEGVEMPTESFLNEIYGTLPTVQPMFAFETRQQFGFIKGVARDLGYFTMDEEHLKEG